MGPINVKESDHVELFGITILLTNTEVLKHIDNLWNYKLHALRRMRKYLAIEKPKLQFCSFNVDVLSEDSLS